MTPAACGITTAVNRYSRHYLGMSTLRISSSRRIIRIWTDNLQILISSIGNRMASSYRRTGVFEIRLSPIQLLLRAAGRPCHREGKQEDNYYQCDEYK